MANTIPASKLASVTPAVLGTGGTPLGLNGVFITRDVSIPLGSVQSFADADAVESWFGIGSVEASLADNYFLGFDNSQIKPQTLYFAQSNSASVPAYLRSSKLALSLVDLQGLSGTLTLTIDGTARTSSALNFASATSFSAAAALIQTAIGSSVVVTYDSLRAAFLIKSATAGASSTITYAANALATSLGLTQATGAVLSQGAVAATPASTMALVKAATQNWISFTTMYEPTLADKQAFAAWSNSDGQRWEYVCADSDATASQSGNVTSFGPLMKAAGYNGVCAIWGTLDKAAFICGAIASIDYTKTNGRISFDYKSQAGLTADVTDATIADNLIANGYNFYGAYATANDQFTGFQSGSVPGVWKWLDPYVNEIWLNNQFQLAMITYKRNSRSVPYNVDGYGGIRAALLDPIKQAINAGVIRSGVVLSEQQKSVMNADAGVQIDTTVFQEGWYLKVADPGAQVRGVRGSPDMTVWYTDGGSVRTMNLSSVAVL